MDFLLGICCWLEARPQPLDAAEAVAAVVVGVADDDAVGVAAAVVDCWGRKVVIVDGKD